MPVAAKAQHCDVIVLGAGGAGLMCAGVAGARGRSVVLLDHAEAPGKKILISGGGRCNFTNIGASPENYLSRNGHFARSALTRYTPADFIARVDQGNIAWHEKTLGQLFCDGSARQIVEMLVGDCTRAGVRLITGASITDIAHADGQFRVTSGKGAWSAPSLVLATGGPSIPKMGATGFAYDIARQFGLRIVTPRPALVPLTLGADEALFTSLSGVASTVVARTDNTAFREAALFTHKGLSGPAILQVSSYWRDGTPVTIDFCPDRPAGWLQHMKRTHGRSRITPLLAEALPTRLAETLAERLTEEKLRERELANWPDGALATSEDRKSVV